MLDYGRNIESFCVLPDERRLVAGNLLGQLLVMDIDSFRIEREYDAHAGMIIALDAHPTLPYVCALGVDHVVTVWKHDNGHLTRVLEASLLVPRPENKHEYPPVTSVSQAIAFHPVERRLLSRTANGAVVEIVFGDSGFDFNWCRAFYPGRDTGYVRYLEDPELILVESADGTIGVFRDRDREKPILEYRYNHEQIHAAVHLEGTHYLLASDARRVIRFDMSGRQAPVVGPAIVRDHLERICYSKVSKRAFVSSFDRRLYEVCPQTGKALRVIAQTPFKCRWLTTLDRDPDVLIAQCRNGALYKMDLGRAQVTGVIKETPNALWSAARRGDSLLIAGEGSEILELAPAGIDPETRAQRFETRWIDLGCDPGVYTKRAAVHGPSQQLLLARTDGHIYTWDGSTTRSLVDLGSPLRDVAVAPEAWDAFAVTEDGVAHRIDLRTGEVVQRFRSPRQEPLWSLAHNPKRGLLAVAEREGALYMLSDTSLECQMQVPSIRRSKRARWLDDNRLLVVSINNIIQLDMATGRMDTVVSNERNTIEDFAWSDDRRYLVLVSYAQDVALFDLRTRLRLNAATFEMHYPKGVEWLPQRDGSYRYELIVWGRSGVPWHYRVHGAKVVPLGKLTDQLSRVDQRAGIAVLNQPVGGEA